MLHISNADVVRGHTSCGLIQGLLTHTWPYLDRVCGFSPPLYSSDGSSLFQRVATAASMKGVTLKLKLHTLCPFSSPSLVVHALCACPFTRDRHGALA